ncbi:N-acetyl sugar amidotransferase [Thalassospira lucentensis]|uniref:N-acetyl sugar amidotransferase n=1 Tax=Thalassospira lucentensis TaxID=168935 RepID=UPI003D2EF23C
MKFCTRCLYPENHPLGLIFDADGVCSGCRIHEEKDELDWDLRFARLRSITDAYRSRNNRQYDCIVPVSGARDSWFIVDTIRRKLKLNPLLVSYNTHYMVDRGHRNMSYLRTVFDLDCHTMILGKESLRRITEKTIDKLGSIYWHCLAGHSVFPVQMAVRHQIPLIIWGAHQGLDQVGMFSHTDEVEMTRKYRKDHDLMGVEAEDLVNEADGLPERMLAPLFYPNDHELHQVGVRGIYLGNYIRWDSKAQHEEMIQRHGFETGAQKRTFDHYNHVDCAFYSGLHDYIKLLKHGYGKVSDHASREIRLRRMTREQGISQVAKYQDIVPDDSAIFARWLGISEPSLMQELEKHRNQSLWSSSVGGAWNLHESAITASAPDNLDEQRLKTSGDDWQFPIRQSRNPDIAETEPSILQRGYVDGQKAPSWDR